MAGLTTEVQVVLTYVRFLANHIAQICDIISQTPTRILL